MDMSYPMSFEKEVIEYETLWEFLKKIKMESVFEDLKAAEVTYDRLKFMIPEDVRDTIRKVGPRAEFRERILRMKRTEFGSIKGYTDFRVQHKNLDQLINRSPEGLTVLQSFKTKLSLSQEERDVMVKLLIGEAETNRNAIKMQTLSTLLDEIVTVFPTEESRKIFKALETHPLFFWPGWSSKAFA
ncbi:uncharacterized protein LOC117895472 isoform X1 [Drosophila subobscura]|uniref:uncharacterized protein LOC117895472 isoform X1 n=1 Tax=Drosophila subobscura TaxID=7241 RepID=UPI00155A2316|nr:uncharacterized protein LOC117895472 isoform X1 [Drosophila subobscura]